MQEGLLRGAPKHDLLAVVERINRLALRVRRSGGSVFFVQHAAKLETTLSRSRLGGTFWQPSRPSRVTVSSARRSTTRSSKPPFSQISRSYARIAFWWQVGPLTFASMRLSVRPLRWASKWSRSPTATRSAIDRIFLLEGSLT